MITKMKYGARKGKMNFWRRWFAKVASQELIVFPVPGADILRQYQDEPMGEEGRLAVSPREANVLLIVGDLNTKLAEHAATVYVQMPRPRVLVMAGPEHLEPLPHPDVHTALKKGFLAPAMEAARKCLADFAWNEKAKPYRPETHVKEMEKAAQQKGHMHDHGGHGDHGHGEHDHSQSGIHDHVHEGHDHSAHKQSDHGEHEGHDHSAHQQDNADGGHNHDHGDHENLDHSHSDEVETENSKNCHDASDKHGNDHGSHQHGSHSTQKERQKHDHGNHNHGHKGHEHKSHDHGDHQHGEQEHDHSGHNDGGHEDDHSQHGGHGHDHGSGFMSMIAMTKDLPRSPDGLPMEWSDVQFGPFHQGLPGGLRVSIKLDGDTVAEAEVDLEFPNRNLQTFVPEDPAELPEYLESVNPMAPVSYRLLAHKALANFSGDSAHTRLTLDEAVLLEKERVINHLNWLAVFSTVLGSDWMRNQAIKHYHHFQNDNGNKEDLSVFIGRIKKLPYLKIKLSTAGLHRFEMSKATQQQGHLPDRHGHGEHDHGDEGHDHSTHQQGNADGGHNHNHEAHNNHGHSHSDEVETRDSNDCHGAPNKPDHDHETDEQEHSRHGHEGHDHGVHTHSHADHEHQGSAGHRHETLESGKDNFSRLLKEEITGPVARAADIRKDVRLNEEVYQENGWSSAIASGNDAWSRLLVRLDEISDSLRFIEKAKSKLESDVVTRRAAVSSYEGSGEGISHIESPRGEVSLRIHIHDGKLAHLHLTTSSSALVKMTKFVTQQQELADALIAVSSLDISPWEINF